ncbi:pentapeptide repeat-containing protein [Candidatus Sodalis endolongispinus]|uniref:Pentapeptide repeat-containing protein n=1 Tax=Candidatus Sodalis endolongispinus TaxID=2812662 RepID=A0ABS5YCJ0_9GAMM|nr:pentapeptide repeat-containing protein [Candidatus Sodalis endolongispinus]MBT9431816.1 pentapeptide repeat-containing protein [Candidatus Sodalis endolongispinus]
MITTHTSINSTLDFARAAGTGSSHAMKDDMSPTGILENVLDILTFGGIRREKKNLYTVMMDKMVEALNGTDITEPRDIILHDVSGYKVSFKLTSMDSDEKKVTAEVGDGGHAVSHKIALKTYHDVCRTLMLRNQFQLPQDPVILTEQGKMKLIGTNLAREYLAGLDLSGADLSHANLSRTNLAGAHPGRRHFGGRHPDAC